MFVVSDPGIPRVAIGQITINDSTFTTHFRPYLFLTYELLNILVSHRRNIHSFIFWTRTGKILAFMDYILCQSLCCADMALCLLVLTSESYLVTVD